MLDLSVTSPAASPTNRDDQSQTEALTPFPLQTEKQEQLFYLGKSRKSENHILNSTFVSGGNLFLTNPFDSDSELNDSKPIKDASCRNNFICTFPCMI